MGEKNKKNSGEQRKEGAENKKKEDGGGKNSITVVLKADLHCEGCITKVLKCIRSFDGVETASIGGEQKITVVGKMDPAKLRQRVEQKTHKRVELIPPQTKKDGNDKEKAKGKENSGGDNGEQEKKKEAKDKISKNKSDEKKSKELPVTTAVLKVQLHCEGCTQKIQRIISKTKGYREVKFDKKNELVIVTGAIDINALTEVLKKHLKREVQVVPPPKKEAEKKENSGGEKGKSGGEKGKGGGDKGKTSGGGGDKGKTSGGGGDKGKTSGGGSAKAAGGEKAEESRVQFQVGNPYPFVYESGIPVDQCQYSQSYGHYHSVHAPQLFSDENPNACSVM